MPHAPESPCTAEPTCPHTKPCPDHPPRARTAARGYGGPHQRIRKQLEELHPRGPCARCGKPGTWDADAADPLTAGHIDHDGHTVLSNYQPEHRSCGSRERIERHSR